MRIAVTAQGNDVTAPVDPRFGRCQYFIIYDTDTNEFVVRANESVAKSGAGIQSAQFMIDNNVRVVISGEVGPNARQVLQSAGIEIRTTTARTVREAVEQFLKGGYT
jgi:predicted Fe-Mo cluster-binding NifX family protein